MRPAHVPPHRPFLIETELRLNQIKIDPQLPINLSAQPVLDHFINEPPERNQHQGGRCCIPQGQTKANGAPLPPSVHAPPSARKTNPTPRTV